MSLLIIFHSTPVMFSAAVHLLKSGLVLRFKHRANICFFCHISNAFYIGAPMQNNLIPTNYDRARRRARE